MSCTLFQYRETVLFSWSFQVGVSANMYHFATWNAGNARWCCLMTCNDIWRSIIRHLFATIDEWRQMPINHASLGRRGLGAWTWLNTGSWLAEAAVSPILLYSHTKIRQQFAHERKNRICPFFRPPGAANPQKGRRHIRNQSTPACKIWRELARGLLRNRWPNKKKTKNGFCGAYTKHRQVLAIYQSG